MCKHVSAQVSIVQGGVLELGSYVPNTQLDYHFSLAWSHVYLNIPVNFPALPNLACLLG